MRLVDRLVLLGYMIYDVVLVVEVICSVWCSVFIVVRLLFMVVAAEWVGVIGVVLEQEA